LNYDLDICLYLFFKLSNTIKLFNDNFLLKNKIIFININFLQKNNFRIDIFYNLIFYLIIIHATFQDY